MQSTGIILAGGQSSRMGTNKALLSIDGKTVIETIVSELRNVTNRLLIVTNSFESYQFLQLPMVEDHWKGKGPLAGIHAGLTASETEHNLIVACDMPFVSTQLGEFLLKNLTEDLDAVVPNIDGQLHPLFAAYQKRTAATVEKAIIEDKLRIRQVLASINTKVVTEVDITAAKVNIQPVDLFNMNYPDEYEQAVQLTEKGRWGS